MKPTEPESLGEHVEPKLDDARLARQWGGISARLGRPSTSRRWLVGVAVVPAVVAVAAVLMVRPWRSGPTHAEVATSGPLATAHTITLPDGSQVTLDPDAALTIGRAAPTDVQLVLDRGTVEAEVTHRDGRSFVISAAGHEVVVIGTHFRVTTNPTAEGSTLRVEVQRGLVRVEGTSGTHLLAAGQTWSTNVARSAEPPPMPSAEPSAAALAAEPVPAAAESAAVKAAPAAESPRELLARATEARAAGRYREAVAALETIRKRHRTDPRAGLAAFELGRMRLDALGDPAGAAEAFADAVALSPQGSWVEDAEARRVEALEGAGNRAACEKARAAYLARYPSGIHVRSVSQRCRR